MQWYISELMKKEDLKLVLEEYGCGIELVSLSIPEQLDHLDTAVREIRALLDFLGNPPRTVHGPTLDLNPISYDEKIRQISVDRFERAYEGAARLGADKIVFHSGNIPGIHYLEGWAERMSDFWNHFLEGKRGIGVCMENALDHEIQPFLQVVRSVEHPDFGICLDFGHAHCYSRHSVKEWAEVLKDHITHVHIHDNRKDWDYHLAVGDGNIPFAEILPGWLGTEKGPSAALECTSIEDIRKSFLLLGEWTGG